MGRVYDPTQEEWKRVERRGAKEVFSHILLPQDPSVSVRLGLTRIEAGSTLGIHVDDYSHIFCVREGHGQVQIGKVKQPIGPGDVITTEIGEPHGLWADEDADLVLVTANVYPQES
jgi:quercetin dioxygenase-like cupin family protein